jgi:hypothetical protein
MKFTAAIAAITSDDRRGRGRGEPDAGRRVQFHGAPRAGTAEWLLKRRWAAVEGREVARR